MDPEIIAVLHKGIEEFNDEDFFECHETLEDIWVEARGDEKIFFQGLIQVAVGLYHWTGYNYVGGENLLTAGIKKLERFEPEWMGVPLTKLLEEARACVADIRAVKAGKKEEPDFSLIPKIEMNK
jgi:predicted metal-dependent hydrolase